MTREWSQQSREPSPEQLSAYADGELQEREREQVEAWLAGHPETAAEVETWRRLARLWQNTAAPEPSQAAWDSTLARVEAGLPPRKAGLSPARRLGTGLGVAAAVLLALLLARAFWSVKPVIFPPPPVEEDEGPFSVASAQDVTILSMDASDTDALVSVQPPIMDKQLPLAEHGDVTLIGQMTPEIRLQKWASPMIVDPLALLDWKEEQDD